MLFEICTSVQGYDGASVLDYNGASVMAGKICDSSTSIFQVHPISTAENTI